MVFQLSFSVRH